MRTSDSIIKPARPADRLVGKECQCVDTEQAVVDGDYVWRA